jgi:hypothetical protein
MHDIPHAVLSERFQEHMQGRLLKSAVFMTFRFEPDFFEQEVLPVVLPDMPLSHVPAIRLLFLEEALKSLADHVAVYYDRSALVAGAQSAKLDVRRIAISHTTGCFHPKNVLLLTESAEPDAAGRREQRLTVATLSANLTRRGWWENVEVCHIEEITDGARCSIRDDLLDLIKRVKAASPAGTSHEALDEVRAFARRLIAPRRTTDDTRFPRLYTGGQTVVDFMSDVVEDRLDGLCLEVVSPYFDQNDAAPLRALCDRFRPREVRVFLPRAEDESAQCNQAVFDAVLEIDHVHWARLPAELLSAGKNEQVKRRTVHAKVYRFFHPSRRYEAFLVGSVNLTTAAHSKSGNFETAFLLESEPKRVPGWWLDVDRKKPPAFLGCDGEDASMATTALSIRYDWAHGTAAAYWDAGTPPGMLSVGAQGAPLFEIATLVPRDWTPLPKDAARALTRILESTSFLTVMEDGGTPATILVQEEGMAHKPSILLSLTAADILRYWALLTPEQRAAFLDARMGAIPEALAQLGIDGHPLAQTQSSIFDTFAGIYHAFGALEQFVVDALQAGRVKEAEYRLLGKKYDSLPSLIERVQKQPDETDLVSRYVMVLCAKQLVRRVERDASEFRERHASAFRALKAQIARAERVRDQLSFGTADERVAFLEWFERWFLTRAEPQAEVV